MRRKQTVLMAVLAVAMTALLLPLFGVRAASSPKATRALRTPATPAAPAALTSTPAQQAGKGQYAVLNEAPSEAPQGLESPDVVERLFGIRAGRKVSKASAEKVRKLIKSRPADAVLSPQAGEPEILNATSALSAAIATTIGGRNTQFSEVALLADWDGREDCTADRSAKVDDFSFVEPEIDGQLTRVAISEHTFANGFTENIFYYGDSLGNVWVGVDSTGDGFVEQVLQINIPTVLNAFGTVLSDDQITITGLAVNPVADLTSFPNVNGAYDEFVGQIGEILYVTYHDAESGLRLAANNQLVRSGLLAFPVADLISGAAAPPSPIQDSIPGFPVTIGGAFGVAFSVFANIAGCAVDDDGSVYFHQADTIGFTGGNVVKVTDVGANQDRSAAVSGILTITSLNPAGRLYGTTSGPSTQVNRFTNYSGTSTTFGNLSYITNGPCNTLYGALTRSLGSGDPVTEGLYPAPSQFPNGMPSLVISFADCHGAFDLCTSPADGFPGQIPIADGLADAASGSGTGTAGVNNFRVFVHGAGPDIRGIQGLSGVSQANDLRIPEFQVDLGAHNGLAVDENWGVYVISGGTPAGSGRNNPSPALTDILWFEDMCPMDRRADFVDLRGNQVPNPPASGGNVGDGDSDLFDHLFYRAPLDQVSLGPTGLAGLSRGFLLYLNRTRNADTGRFADLPNGGTQGDDDTGGFIFEDFDLGHQVAGGDDQTTPFRGDDDNGAGTPTLVGPLSGGFEFVFGGPVGTANCVWNGAFLNSNGNLTFGTGDTSNTANVLEARSGAPRVAPAWTDLNPASRVQGFLNTFPVQALGFSGVNSFEVRWINVPEFGLEDCGSSNTFSVTLWDDGTGIDENANQPLNPANPIGNNAVPFDLQEGPTDLRWTREPNTQILVGCSSRGQGTGNFSFEYCRMDLLGTEGNPVYVGYSIGGLEIFTPPGLCEINLSTAAAAADLTPFGVIQGQTASICPCLIGEGTEPEMYEFFDQGTFGSVGNIGQVTFATPDFDLRHEGNDAQACTPARQSDVNRMKVGLYGVGCAPPPNPICSTVQPTRPVAVAPNQPAVSSTSTTGIINALCDVQLNMVGCGFFPNETTIICQGFTTSTGVPLQRPGKTVTTAATLTCDTNGDGTPEAVIALGNVLPVNKNLVRGTLVSLSAAGLPGTAFPLTCCGGSGFVTVTTAFSAGDNNVFGPFTRTTTCNAPLGNRAPVVISIAPSDGDCANEQDTLISGACFRIGNVDNVTSVFAVEFNRATQTLNTANTIQARRFQILDSNLIDALFSFGTVNAGKTFLIFVSGPNGTSRNLTQGQTPAGCVFGNEQGIQVTFTCNVVRPPCNVNSPVDANCPCGSVLVGGVDPRGPCVGPPETAVVNACNLRRSSSGAFSLEVIGSNIKNGATLTLNGKSAAKIKLQDQQSNGTFNKIIVKKSNFICANIPGAIIVTNPGAPASPAFSCQRSCPTQQ